MAESHVLHSLKEKRASVAGGRGAQNRFGEHRCLSENLRQKHRPGDDPGQGDAQTDRLVTEGRMYPHSPRNLARDGRGDEFAGIGRLHPATLWEASGGTLADLGSQCVALEFQSPKRRDFGVRPVELSGEVATITPIRQQLVWELVR